MSAAWGAAWGSSWGSTWGFSPAPADIPVHRGHGGIVVSRAYAEQADRNVREFDESRRKDQKALRKSVDRAFRAAYGLPLDDETVAASPAPAATRQVAAAVQADLELRGLVASLGTVERLIEQMLGEVARQKQIREDEEAAVWLLLNVI